MAAALRDRAPRGDGKKRIRRGSLVRLARYSRHVRRSGHRNDCMRFTATRAIGVAQFSGTTCMSAPHSCAMITGISGQDGALLAAHLLAAGSAVVGTHRPGREPDLWRLRELGIGTHPRLRL